jgi:hypothetical protein
MSSGRAAGRCDRPDEFGRPPRHHHRWKHRLTRPAGASASPLGDGIRTPILTGSLLSGVSAYLSVRFLTRWYETRSMRPFAIYCIIVGVGCLACFSLR